MKYKFDKSKLKFLIFLLSVLLLGSCSLNYIEPVRDDFSPEEMEDTYGDGSFWRTAFHDSDSFPDAVKSLTSGIIKNPNLKESKKEALVEKLKRMKFKDGKYISFGLTARVPVLKKYRNPRIVIKNKKGTSGISFASYFLSNSFTVYTRGGSWTYYNYDWFLILEKAISEENNSVGPQILTASFPKGKLLKFPLDPQ